LQLVVQASYSYSFFINLSVDNPQLLGPSVAALLSPTSVISDTITDSTHVPLGPGCVSADAEIPVIEQDRPTAMAEPKAVDELLDISDTDSFYSAISDSST